jgi:DNA-binding response OmpR family regulator
MPSRTVLIIDDDDALLPMLKTAFQRYKFDVLVTSDGADGLEKARAARPDLVLLSVELPVGNGFLVCKEFKQDAELKDIPVIITSRKASDADFEKHRKLKIRANDYLHKPFTDEELFAKVGNVVGFSISPDEYSELEAKVHDFLEERHKLEAEIAEKADRIAHLEGELAAAKKGGGEKAEKKLAELEAKIAELEMQVAERDGRVSELETAATDADERAAAIEAQAAELRVQAERAEGLEAEVAQLEGKLSQREADFASEAGSLQGEVRKTEQARDKALADLNKALADASEAAAERDGLALQVAAAEQERNELKERLAAAENEVREAAQVHEREVKKRQKLREVLEKAIAALD